MSEATPLVWVRGAQVGVLREAFFSSQTSSSLGVASDKGQPTASRMQGNSRRRKPRSRQTAVDYSSHSTGTTRMQAATARAGSVAPGS
jgi:hypothetical protein